MTERGRPHTIQEWLSQPSERRLELIDGEFVEKAAPDPGHAVSQGNVIGLLHSEFHRKPASAGPRGGWWILPEVDIQLGENGFRPDVAGWKRAHSPTLPEGRPVVLRPDWICEVLSTNRRNDLIKKKRAYHRYEIGHYWLVDPVEETLAVYRWHPDGYVEVLIADREERVRAEPFGEIELKVSTLFGEDDDE